MTAVHSSADITVRMGDGLRVFTKPEDKSKSTRQVPTQGRALFILALY